MKKAKLGNRRKSYGIQLVNRKLNKLNESVESLHRMIGDITVQNQYLYRVADHLKNIEDAQRALFNRIEFNDKDNE